MARYPKAQWIGANPANFSAGKISHKRIVIHVEAGTETGTDAWFNNPKAQVSAHFGNPKKGRIQQFVDTTQTAYHCAQFNGESIGIEHEGLSGQSLNRNQLKNLKAVLLWIHAEHQTPLVYTGDPLVSGVIGHGRLPEGSLSHPSCPGEPILAQVAKLLGQMARPSLVKRVLKRITAPVQAKPAK